MPDIPAVTREGGTTTLKEQAVRAMQEALAGPLVVPGDEDYDPARRVWNGMIDRHPALIARCRGTADVMAAVGFAREHDLLVAVRGGAHNVAGNAVCDGGLVIDLSPMRGVWVDPANHTARVQGGVTWGEVDHETQAFGLATPGGVVSDTGVAGLTLGGGLGWLRRTYGLSCDNLCSVDIVTADGEFLRSSETENEDLFWAVRGGGGNFGVVTSFDFRLYPVGPTVPVALTFYPLEAVEGVLNAYRQYAAGVPDEVNSMVSLWTVPATEEYPAELHGTPSVVLQGCWLGSMAEAEEALRPLREAGRPLFDASGSMPFVDLQRAFDRDYPWGRNYYWKSIYLNQLGDGAITTLAERIAECPSPDSNVDIWHLGGAIRRLGPGETAFARREPEFLVSVEANWEDRDRSEENVAWARDLWNRLRPFSDGGVYQNFPGYRDESPSVARAAYGANYDRLARVKARYDPENRFRLNLNVEPGG